MAEVMSGSTTVPGVGKVKKTYLYGALGLTGAYVAWRWYQARQDSAEIEYTTDYVSEPLPTGGAGAAGGSGNVQYAGTVTDATSGAVIDTNAEWTQRAVELLSNAGYNPTAVYGALGDYLSNAPLTGEEQTIVRAALAAVGKPPVGGPYVITEQTGPVTLKAPQNVAAKDIDATHVTLVYEPVEGAASYTAYDSNSKFAAGVGYGNNIRIGSLTPNKRYSFTVAARTATGKAGPKSSPVSFTTTGAKLSRPTGVKAKPNGRTSVRLTWNGVGGTQTYLVQGPGRTFESVDRVVVWPGLRPNTTYRFRVAGLQPGTRTPGPYSGWVTAKTKK